MATRVNTTEDIILSDGTEVELSSLPISRMRKSMKLWYDHQAAVATRFKEATKNDTAEGEENSEFDDIAYAALQYELADKQYSTYIKICELALEVELKGDRTNKQFTEYLEETLDDPTIQKILEKCVGLRVGESADPNQMTPTTE